MRKKGKQNEQTLEELNSGSQSALLAKVFSLEGVLCGHEADLNFSFRSLFPCGDTMVCIIDDREDVWNFASNLVHVKPYQFFKGVGDINAPPGGSPSSKEENTSPGQPVGEPEMHEGDIKPEELNSQEDSEDFKEEQEKSNTVFEENVNSEETESKAVREEKMDLLNKSAEACKNNTKPVVEKCKDNRNMKTVVETVEPSETSSKVLENGGSNDANEVADEKQSTETLEQLNENIKDTEQNNNGKTESSEEQKTSDCSDNTKDETVQQRGEGGKCHSSGLSRNACDNAKNVTVEVSVKPWPNRVATSRRKLGLLATPFGQA